MTLDEAILRLVEEQQMSDQSTLLRSLESLGHRITQSTLSRHLRKLGIRKAAGRYRTAGEVSAALPAFTLEEVSPCLIVLRTRPGYAQPLAVALDQSQIDAVAGTLAGDDTIFLAVRPDYQGDLARVSEQIKSVLNAAPVQP